jgi:hypothetical protein
MKTWLKFSDGILSPGQLQLQTSPTTGTNLSEGTCTKPVYVCVCMVLFSLFLGTNRPISVFWAGFPGTQVTIFFPWAYSQSWLPQPLGFKGATLRSIDTLHVMFLISWHVEVYKVLVCVRFLSIQVAWQTFTTVSTWGAEMSLNCLFLGQPIFNLLPLPIEETIRLGCLLFFGNKWKNPLQRQSGLF